MSSGLQLGIESRNAVVCAASKGLGFGCALALAQADVNVTVVARTRETLDAAVERLGEIGAGTVSGVAADVTTDDGRAQILESCPAPDILVNNAGGPPAGDFREWGRSEWLAAIEANMLAPIELIRATVDGMIERGFGRVVNITSHAVKEPVGMLGLSNGARAGLTGFVAGLARDVAASGVTINNLLPGQFDTDRLRVNHEGFAARLGMEAEVVRDRARSQIPAGRFGRAEEFGATCAYLCSQHAGFLTGQNILLDGGQYRGLL